MLEKTHSQLEHFRMWHLYLLVAIASWLIYQLFVKGSKDFWKEYGVLQVPYSSIRENIGIFTGKKTFADMDELIYKSMGESRFCGIMQMTSPFLFVKDLDIVKKILIKEFDHFVDRRPLANPKSQPTMNKMLTNLTGEEWKSVRASLSPTFTTGKIRRMMDSFNEVGKEWMRHLEKEIQKSGHTPFKMDVVLETRNFSVDVIAHAVFGLRSEAISNPNDLVSQTVSQLSTMNVVQFLKFGLCFSFPELFDLLRLKLIDQDGIDFFQNVFLEALKKRMDGREKKNDFVQLIAELRKGVLKAQGSDELSAFEKEALLKEKGNGTNLLHDDIITSAQLLNFFFAGFSTTSNFIGFLLYSLALNPECQDRLRHELDSVLFKDGQEDVDYDLLNGLPYLDMCVCEGLRKFPPLPRLERKCTKEYFDFEHKFKVPKDANVAIPVQAIHNDRKYYEHPDKFYPEHFTPQKKAERNSYAYLPFGAGARSCIGMRFALVEVKTALAHLIRKFEVSPATSTPVPITGKPIGGLVVNLPDNLELILAARRHI